MVIAAVEVSRKLQLTSLVWVVRYDNKKQRVEPFGLALLANKPIVVPGDGDILLV